MVNGFDNLFLFEESTDKNIKIYYMIMISSKIDFSESLLSNASI